MHKVATAGAKKALIWGIVLNLGYTAVEYVMGFMYDSLALLSDASHNLGDTISLLLAYFAFKLAEHAETGRFTYGYKKATVMASLINAVGLVIIAGGILVESYDRLIHPQDMPGLRVSAVAGIGIIINTATALLFLKDKDNDINIKGAFLHMAADALVSVGVVISGLLIYFMDWTIADPIISVVIAGVIIYSTWGVLKESFNLSMDGVPEGIDMDEIRQKLTERSEVRGIHHVHLWPLSTTENAMTVHLEVEPTMSLKQVESMNHEIKADMQQYGVQHITIEVDAYDGSVDRKQEDGQHPPSPLI